MDYLTNGSEVFVVTFVSTHQTLKCERHFKSLKIDFQLMPVPRQISSSCGLAARVRNLSLEQLLSALTAPKIGYQGIYRIDGPGEELVQLVTKDD